jgi:hypothetical protein
MKKFIVLIMVVTFGSLLFATKAAPVKPSETPTTTAMALKLAEAKAVLSKANTKKVKSNLATADGGI